MGVKKSRKTRQRLSNTGSSTAININPMPVKTGNGKSGNLHHIFLTSAATAIQGHILQRDGGNFSNLILFHDSKGE